MPFDEAEYKAAPPHFLDFGDLKATEIDDVLFISVPVATSAASCERLRDIVNVALKDKKLCVVLSHNIELLRARKLTAAQTARVLGRVQDHEAEALTKVQAELQFSVYQRVRNTLDHYQRDLDQALAGDAPDCMSSHTDMASWAMDFLVGLRKLVDGVEAQYAEQTTDSETDEACTRH